MESLLTEEVVSEYEKNGAICLRNVFDKKWVDAVAAGIEKNLKSPSKYAESLKEDGGPGAYIDDYCNWRRIPEFEDYVNNSPAAEIACRLMKSRYAAFYHEHVLVKEPGTYKKTPWHHDQSYYPIDGFKVCSIWMPVDPVEKETSIKFVAGSHLWDTWFYPVKFATTLNYEKDKPEDKIYHNVPDIDADKEKYKIIGWKVMPGDCVVFHMRTLHAASGNLSLEKSRRVLSTRWLGDDAVITSRPWKVSPPMFQCDLKPGDSAASEYFPIIWQEAIA